MADAFFYVSYVFSKRSFKPFVESMYGFADKAFNFGFIFFRFQNQSAQRRSQRQCDKCRKHHGNGNGNGKLLIKLANRTAGKRSRDKYRGKYEGNGHNRAGNFAHGAVGCFFRRKASILNMMLYRFYNDDSVVNYEADSKDKCESRQRINGKAQKYERSKSTNQRYRYCQQRNQRCAPAAEEHEDYKNNQYQRFKEGMGYLVQRFGNKLRVILNNRQFHICRETFFGVSQNFADLRNRFNGVGVTGKGYREYYGSTAVQTAEYQVASRCFFNAGNIL